MAGGRNTTSLYWSKPQKDLAEYEKEPEDVSDHYLPGNDGHYSVVFDRYGKCQWDENEMSYGGKSTQIVEVLTKKAKK